MDRKKLIVVGVLVLLLGAVYFMRSGEPPTPEDHDEDEPAATQPTPAPSPAPGAPKPPMPGAPKPATPGAPKPPTPGTPKPATPGIPKPTTTVEKNVTTLQKTDIKIGTGKAAKTGDTVTVQYRGTLTNGTKFDASYDRNEPFTFPLGGGQVIPGWDQGVVGMKEGGKRKLVIPSDLAYGDEGRPPTIPPKATLVFEIELVKVG